MNEGWVKIYRKLLDNPIMQEPELLQLFIYLVLRANHADKPFFWNSESITVKRGSLITGRFEMAKTLKQNPNTIYKRMQKLEKLGFCNIKTNSKNSLVTLLKYDYYQGGLFNENVNRNNTVTTREQQSNTNKNDKNDKNKKLSNQFAIKNLPIGLNGELFYQNKFFYVTTDLKNELQGKLKDNMLTDGTMRTEFGKMEVWLEANGAKKNYKMFLLNWLSKVQGKPKEQITSGLRLLTKDEPAWL